MRKTGTIFLKRRKGDGDMEVKIFPAAAGDAEELAAIQKRAFARREQSGGAITLAYMEKIIKEKG